LDQRQNLKEQQEEILESAFLKFPDEHKILTQYAMFHLHEDTRSFESLYQILKKSFKINPDYVETRLHFAYLISLTKPQNKDELFIAKNILIKTLELNINIDYKHFAVSVLNLICTLLKDDVTKSWIQKKFPNLN
jgi:hypothetical protein